MKVAVIAHGEKTVGGGLPELRRALEAAGIGQPLWYEVPRAKNALNRPGSTSACGGYGR